MLRDLFAAPAIADEWLTRWRESLDSEKVSGTSSDEMSREERRVALMRQHNPIFIPRNHRIEEAIEALQEAIAGDDKETIDSRTEALAEKASSLAERQTRSHHD